MKSLIQIRESEKPVVLKFYADWCQPCKALTPMLNDIKGLYPNIDFMDVDVDQEENKELKKAFNVRGIPALIFVIPGKEEVLRVAGAVTPERIISTLETLAQIK